MGFSSKSTKFLFLVCLSYFLVGTAFAQLSTTFYAKSCPNALSTIKSVVDSAVKTEARMGASLLRLHFHDCFLLLEQGCDGSILLDDTANFTGEKTAGSNLNSVRGYDVIDTIKSQLESLCPGVVSCADIVAVAARDGTVALNGPSWAVQLGRRDSTTASLSAANANIPSFLSNLTVLISDFSNKGFTAKELVALSGSHTIGQARCITFRTRIYNETNINSAFATSLQANCPSTGGDANLSPLDTTSPTTFDNAYFTNLRSQKGLLHSDQQLFSGGSTNAQVIIYSTIPATFRTDFGNAMIKMGSLSPLTGTSGQIRNNCRKNQNLDVGDLVALSGAHTIGFSRCVIYRSRIYNDTNIDPAFAQSLKYICPPTGGDSNLAPLDPTPARFDTAYYSDLLHSRGLLHSDQALFSGGSTDDLVTTYSYNPLAFFAAFAKSMVKMGNIEPLTGNQGQIRRNCRVVN
ncbi:peroxidase domain-containing protein [Cephalotus follicularis]|uniref:peroxidase n=1 Tax=Cephalotus follicularis TaxID=3775 RepID=A0A1Q3DGB0_CEPFO|nr:peroxidase domain-containing protein [Cephalotus follicularis]